MAPSFGKIFGFSSSKNNPLQPAATSSIAKPATQSIYDEYHTPQCNKPSKNQPIVVTVGIESPPIVFYGSPDSSAGAFFSGLFILDVLINNIQQQQQPQPEAPPALSENLEPILSVSQVNKTILKNDYVVLNNVSLYLIQTIKYGKPFSPKSTTLESCNKCTNKITELARWDILTKKMAFAKGSSHSCPFSYVVPGDLPPSTVLSNTNTSIKYELICMVKYLDPITKKERIINLSQPIKILRSILREQDKNSTRIFPPTDVTSTAVIPNVVYPRSIFPVEIRMDNVSTSKRRWRMRKLNWRLEECITVKSNHCESHENKFNEVCLTTKKQKKMVKINKNSGGIGHASLNYHFSLPKKQLNNNNNSIGNQEPNIHPSDHEALQNEMPESTPEYTPLAPAASNWSIGASPMNSNIQSNSLDSMVSLSASNTNTNNNNNNNSNKLSNPNEVILPTNNQSEMYIEEIKTISSGEIKNGWKSDFSGRGRIELVVQISLMNLISMGINNTIAYRNSINSEKFNLGYDELFEDANSGCNCSIDIDDSNNGIYVTHNLILEVVIAEELMQSTLASSNHSTKSRHVPSNISSNSTAAIVTGNISSNRMRSSGISSNTNTNTNTNQTTVPITPTPTGRRTALMEDDFPDHRVGPDHVGGNKTDHSNHQQGLATGVARVLRMQFKVILSERPGMGVSLTDEVPPTYPSIAPLSPPSYAQAADDIISPNLDELVVPLENLENLENLKLA